MKKTISTLAVVLYMLLTITVCFATAINLDDMTTDELLQIQKDAEERLAEINRQYAIEHGNRQIILGTEEIHLFVKDKQKIEPTIERVTADAPEQTSFVWSSSDSNVAAVSSNGTITAISHGDTEITCTAKDDDTIFSTLHVYVLLHVKKISISESKITLLLTERNETAANEVLHANFEPIDVYCQTITWTSSNESVVTIDQSGRLQALTPGKAKVTALSNDDVSSPPKASCEIVVLRAADSIQLNETAITIATGKTSTLKATIMPEDASVKKVAWSSSDSSIATVNSKGLVTAKSNGTCDITCTVEDGSNISAICSITVIQMITSIRSSKSAISLIAGKSQIIKATISPSNATNQDIIWLSSSPNIAKASKSKFSNEIEISAIAKGECTITGIAKDGSGKKVRIKVFVESKEAIMHTGYAMWGTAYGTPWFADEEKNTSKTRTIDGVTVRYYATDVYEAKMKGYGWDDTYYDEILNVTIRPGATKYLPKIKAYQFEGCKRIYSAIVKVHFTDGSSVEISPTYWYTEY